MRHFEKEAPGSKTSISVTQNQWRNSCVTGTHNKAHTYTHFLENKVPQLDLCF